MWESQRILTFFEQKITVFCNIAIWNFNKSLTNNINNFEQLTPEWQKGEKSSNMGC